MKLDRVVQATLRFSFNNTRGCIISNTDARDLSITMCMG